MEKANIRILDELTICKIAAGEVIVSPAFVVKELVENSIDAGATEIMTEVRNAGLTSILVSDNGRGMTRDDALMALEHHATSKLSQVDDLKRIKTYGFRGEAMPSIASVSHMEIVSSVDNEKPGVMFKIEGGAIKSVQPAAAIKGTRISVRNLFYNTPVRKKFLKSENYETALIIEIVTRYALAHPEIRFGLYSNGREVFVTRANSSVYNVINDVFSRDIADNVISEKTTEDCGSYGKISVNVFMAPPHISKPNNRYQYFFVNGRPFKNRAVAHAVMEAYQGHLNPRQYPVIFMFIDMDQQFVDVNIHPTKTDVAFACEGKLHEIVKKIVGSGLNTGNSMPGVKMADFKVTTQIGGDSAPENFKHEIGLVKNSFAAVQYSKITNMDEKKGEEQQYRLFNNFKKCFEPADGNPVETAPPEKGDAAAHRVLPKKIVGQVFNAFIIAEDNDGLLIIDQHVAAEKTLYEKILKNLKERGYSSQALLIPHLYNLTKDEFQIISDSAELFEKYGFDIEIFSNNTVAVRAVPDFISEAAEKELIYEIISIGFSESNKINEDHFCDKIAATMSCKGAIKAGTPMNYEAMELLASDLFKCENPYFCPHGRPIIMKLPLGDILSKFKRSL